MSLPILSVVFHFRDHYVEVFGPFNQEDYEPLGEQYFAMANGWA